MCPGKPSTAGLIKGAPKASEADFIQKHLDMIADGYVVGFSIWLLVLFF